MLKVALPDLKERLREIATQSSQFAGQAWIAVDYRGDLPERVCIRAFAVRGENAGRATAEYFGWCFHPTGKAWAKHGTDSPKYLGWDWFENFSREKTALDYLQASGLWGPWVDDYDPITIESMEEFY